MVIKKMSYIFVIALLILVVTACTDYSDATNVKTTEGTTEGTTELTTEVTTEEETEEPLVDLFISEYYEGTMRDDRYIEIYNNTGETVDLSTYAIEVYFDGSYVVDDFSTTTLEGTLEDGNTLVIFNKRAITSENLDTGKLVATSGINFTGTEVVGLLNDGTLIDVIGVKGHNVSIGFSIGGVENGSLNNTVIRNSSVTNPSDLFDPSEWTVLGADDISDIGVHTID